MAMTTKPICMLCLLGLLLAPFFPLGGAAAEPLTLSNPDAYLRKTRPDVWFPHAAHKQLADCLGCHHDYADGRNMLDVVELEETDPAIRCASCHAGNPTIGLKSAFHQQCIGCHHRMRKAGLATAPELCGECHRR